MNHCFISYKHKTLKLQFPRDGFVAMPPIQRLILNWRSSEKWPYDKSPELHSSCQKFCVVMVVTNGLSYNINFKIVLGEHAPRPPKNTVSYACHINFHFACMSPLLQSLDLPPEVDPKKEWWRCYNLEPHTTQVSELHANDCNQTAASLSFPQLLRRSLTPQMTSMLLSLKMPLSPAWPLADQDLSLCGPEWTWPSCNFHQ